MRCPVDIHQRSALDPRNHSERELCRKKTRPSLPDHLVVILQTTDGETEAHLVIQGDSADLGLKTPVLIVLSSSHRHEDLGSSPGWGVTWRGHFSLGLSLPCL